MSHYETVATGEIARVLEALQTALRARRAARAAYGAALARVDFTTPQAERDAHYATLREGIATAHAAVDAALEALEASL